MHYLLNKELCTAVCMVEVCPLAHAAAHKNVKLQTDFHQLHTLHTQLRWAIWTFNQHSHRILGVNRSAQTPVL